MRKSPPWPKGLNTWDAMHQTNKALQQTHPSTKQQRMDYAVANGGEIYYTWMLVVADLPSPDLAADVPAINLTAKVKP